MTLEEIKQTSPFAMGGENVDYAQYFDGTSYLNMLSLKQVIVGNVTFEPACRLDWHKHPGTQGGGPVGVVTAGPGGDEDRGEPAPALHAGDVIHIPANVKHWHGAAKDSAFQHLAIEVDGTDTSTEWCEAVAEADYEALP